MKHLAFWLRYRMRKVVGHKLGRHQWRWLQPIPDSPTARTEGWYHCDWCGANKVDGVVKLPKPYTGESIQVAADRHGLEVMATKVVQALHDTRWCRCPDNRTMLCGESAEVVKVALTGAKVSGWVRDEGPEIIL